MEDSQILALPPALAAEATQLRRNWETRNRQMMQERLLSQIESSATLSPVFRYNRSKFLKNIADI
jgi:tRNA A37 N6-isopentenylltransferase MiaA